MTQTQDTDQVLLEALLDAMLTVPGALKLIVPFRRAGKEDADPKDPATFVWEDVTGIAPHGQKPHLLTATTAEGSSVDGTASALLRKLQDWRG